MVNPNQPVSDSPVITDSLTTRKHGNFPTSIADAPGFSEFLTQNHIPNAVTIDPTFAHLNGRAIGRGGVQRTTVKEKLAIATVTFASNAAYKNGGMLTDFTTIGAISRFSSVYLVSIQNKTNALYTNFIADVNNSPSLGKIKFYDNTGTELIDGSLAIQNVILKCIVRGS